MNTLTKTRTIDVMSFDFETGTYTTFPGDRQPVDELKVVAGRLAEVTDEIIEFNDFKQTSNLATIGTTNLNSNRYYVSEPIERSPSDDKFRIATVTGSVGKIEEIRRIGDVREDYKWARERVSPFISYRSLLFIGEADALIQQMYDADFPPTSAVVILTAMAASMARYPENFRA